MKQATTQGRRAKRTRAQIVRRWLLFWTLFIGLGAVAGATGMLADPTGKAMGMDAMLPYFQVLPFAEVLFQNFIFSGFALLIVNGLTNLTAAVLLLLKRNSGIVLGGVFGITLMLWICIQFVIFPLNFMSTIYFVFGFCQAITGYAAWVFGKQEPFRVERSDYLGIGNHLHAHLGVRAGRPRAGVLPAGLREDPGGGLHSGAPHKGEIQKCRRGNGPASGAPGHIQRKHTV